MSKKSSKKRNKPYTGAEAAQAPQVKRYSVKSKSSSQIWWEDNKKRVYFYLALAAIAVLVSWGIRAAIN